MGILHTNSDSILSVESKEVSQFQSLYVSMPNSNNTMVLFAWCLLVILKICFPLNGCRAFSSCHSCTRGRQRTALHLQTQGNLTTGSRSTFSTKNLADDRTSYLKRDYRRSRSGDDNVIEMDVLSLWGETVFSKQKDSELRAVTQVSALLDLYNSTTLGTTSDAEISGQIVSKAFEGLIERLFQVRKQTIDGRILEWLESLLWRIGELQLVPTYKSVETLWLMQQQYSQQLHAQETPGKQVGRSVRLLMEWSIHSENSGRELGRPPYEYVIYTLTLAKETNVTMSFRMWDLYSHLQAHDAELSRDLFELFLEILSTSPGSWKARQCDVLQDLERRYRTTGDISFQPSVAELQSALVAAARYGRAAEATWLFRVLRERQTKTQTHTSLNLWFQAICKSKELGSAAYVEHLLESAQADDETSDYYDLKFLLNNRYYYNMALQKWAVTRTPGSGKRAEALFEKMVSIHKETGNVGMRPNEESLHHVVLAYAREEPATLQNLRDAHGFLQRSLQQLGSLRQESSTRHWRTFDNLLEAYSKFYDDPASAAAADKLFRFFLVQHRDGNVSEEPDQYHLGHLLRIWNKAPTNYGTQKSLEFYQLMDSLAAQGKIQNPPDLYNIRQLLGTLSQSGEAGHGEFAKFLLDQILAVETLKDAYDPFVLGHIFWCVIKCNCNERHAEGLRRASEVLYLLESLHLEDETVVRLTGASYKQVISAWAELGGSGAGEQAQLILDKLEHQHFSGNRHARLSWDMYFDAIKAWSKDSSNDWILDVEKVYRRWEDFCDTDPGSSPHPAVDMAFAAAHATCGREGSLDRAKKILVDHNARFESGDDNYRVASFAWHALLDGVSRYAPGEVCKDEASLLFRKMQQVDRLGRSVADIRSSAYVSLVRAWSRSNDKNALEHMESIYESFKSKLKANGSNLQPSLEIVDLLLEKYNEDEKQESRSSERALLLFRDVMRHVEAGNEAMRPGRATSWLLLAILGRSGSSQEHKEAVDTIISSRENALQR